MYSCYVRLFVTVYIRIEIIQMDDINPLTYYRGLDKMANILQQIFKCIFERIFVNFYYSLAEICSSWSNL